jgi:lipopolysaccharide biosynthesis glycosyltransferase
MKPLQAQYLDRLDGAGTQQAQDVISVLITPNANYAQHAAACMASLLAKTEGRFDFVIASSEDPTAFAERIRRSFAGDGRVKIEFRRFEVPGDGPFKIENKRLSPDMFLRFWADELMPGRSRALYLDPDIIAIGGIGELWRTDLGGQVFGAVPIPNSIRLKEHAFPAGSHYFNSGVLLIDLEAWASRRCRERCLDFLQAHPERVHDPDQDVMNLVLMREWKVLDYKWNVINPFYRDTHDLGLTRAEVDGVLADARLVHFNGSFKPWVYLDNHPRQRDYMRALAETDWRDWRPADRTAFNMVRKQVSRFLPERVKQVLRPLLGIDA